MATPTNLSEYYSSQGQALPSLQERSTLYAKAGLGTAQQYLAAGSNNASQNTQLLGYLQGQGNQAQGTTGIQGNGAVAIPSDVATGNVQPTQLPNQPTSSVSTDVYSSANAYLSTLPMTGVAGLDQTLSAMQNRPGQIAQQYDIANKQTKYNTLKSELDVFNEEYRQKYEAIRTDGSQSAGQKQDEIIALDKTRAYKAGTMALQAAFAQQDYQGALTLMNQQSALELEPLKMKYEFFKDQYDRSEDLRFKKLAMDYQFEYDQKKADAERANELKASTTGLLTPEKADELLKDKIGQEAFLNKGVIDLLNQYKTKVESFGSMPSPKEIKEANAFVLDILAPKLSVALGQGGMTGDEIKNKISSLGMKGFGKRESVTLNNTDSILSGVQTLLKGNLNTLEVKYPGIKGIPLFSDVIPVSSQEIESITNSYLDSALSPNNAYSSYINSL